ncbi:hypothetical protein GCM10023091_00420 [Ravibacter arvi]|uniref:Uncharacterized protein n=2 Tax=Ravibacter arvi TaxID=2051041 RepID=A0ABP8LL05_9BACT
MRKRRELDQKRFKISSENQTYLVEMIQSIKDIKLNNAERQKRWIWEGIQAKLLKFRIQSLALSQYQSLGSIAINQTKGILISYFSVRAVIDDEISFGAMMSIQYIVGMVSSPVESLIGFMQGYQDAKISVERINEIYEAASEEDIEREYLRVLPKCRTIELRNISFRYFGSGSELIFDQLNLKFYEGRTTAIVGPSGSGKTTILRLLMRFYSYESGDIFIGNKKLDSIDFSFWRDSCGCVLQENYIYSDTILRNIVIDDDFIDSERLEIAIRVSNLSGFIDNEPFGLNTKIGTSGKGISQGQRQRIMIARAVYKNPSYIFLDEATSSLDANNEKEIIENFHKFCVNRTVVIVAHRLSTVRYVDNIIVLDKGKVVEEGTHNDLVSLRGKYFELIKNQLELCD